MKATRANTLARLARALAAGGVLASVSVAATQARAQANAPAADPLKSQACGSAIEQLREARAGPGAPAGQLESLRSQAATACFGIGSPPARPGRVLQAPVQVPRTVYEVPPQRPLAAPLPQLPPPVAIERGATISSCDAAGCWVSNGGSRLQHVAPSAMAPSGLCGIAPGAAGCP